MQTAATMAANLLLESMVELSSTMPVITGIRTPKSALAPYSTLRALGFR